MAAFTPPRSVAFPIAALDSNRGLDCPPPGDNQKQQGASRDLQGGIGTAANYQKRERSQNWDHMEKCLLVQLVQKRLDTIENKAGDTGSIRRRKQAWRDVYSEFSAKVGGVPRELQRMREQWRRIKHWAKQEMVFYEEAEELDRNRGSRKHNELAKHICDIMNDFETRGPSGGTFQQNDDELHDGVAYHRNDGEHPQYTSFPVVDNNSSQLSTDVSVVSDGVIIPVSLETIQVKQEQDESVNLVDDEGGYGAAPSSSSHAGGVVAIATAVNPTVASSSSQFRKHKERDETLPSWTKDFPEIIGEESAQRPPHDDDDDDDNDSDFLDDIDSDDDMGSLSDWGPDNPVSTRAYDGQSSALPVRRGAKEPGVKFERQRLAFARREFKRRMQMMETEHTRKMQILELRRETALLKKKIVFRQLKQHRIPQSNSSNSFNNRHGNSRR